MLCGTAEATRSIILTRECQNEKENDAGYINTVGFLQHSFVMRENKTQCTVEMLVGFPFSILRPAT